MDEQSAETPAAALLAAQAIVDEQMGRLRDLEQQARREIDTIGASLRQAERQLDEVTLQHRTALQLRTPHVAALGERMGQLRQRCEDLSLALNNQRHVSRQLDQLIRQIEMSSSSLTEITSSSTSDPWALALRAQVIHGREEERVRLAREVHDGPAQVLANSLMLLETCAMLAQQSGSARLEQMIDRLRSATREGLGEVRRFIADLRPGAIHEHGLVEAMKEYLRGYMNAYSARVILEADTIPRLPDEAEIVLYRIVQETLQNVQKYARGATVTIRMSVTGQVLTLSIRDDGPGFDPHEVARRAGRSNWGLTSMRERAELIGARFAVSSKPGHGTEVRLTLPLAA
ncbi:MAG TPA: sensor histidine kinase [Roseiflexaceae bacterium]|nr:sensor histidine kinase [Roseiflexaceae bacterium]HMP41119.1 sensor histidine kinase [Roseiflexaceae bacterium]